MRKGEVDAHGDEKQHGVRRGSVLMLYMALAVAACATPIHKVEGNGGPAARGIRGGGGEFGRVG